MKLISSKQQTRTEGVSRFLSSLWPVSAALIQGKVRPLIPLGERFLCAANTDGFSRLLKDWWRLSTLPAFAIPARVRCWAELLHPVCVNACIIRNGGHPSDELWPSERGSGQRKLNREVKRGDGGQVDARRHIMPLVYQTHTPPLPHSYATQSFTESENCPTKTNGQKFVSLPNYVAVAEKPKFR